MRTGTHDTGWLIENDALLGINLGWDHVSEHEWGIAKLHLALGIHGDVNKDQGLNRFKMPHQVARHSARKEQFEFRDGYLIFDAGVQYLRRDKGPAFDLGYYDRLALRPPYARLPRKGAKKREEEPHKDLLTCAWDDGSFGIHVSPDGQPKLDKLWAAVQDSDIAVWVGGGSGNPFANSGLVIGIYSAIPDSHRETMRRADKETVRLHKAVLKTGIAKRLEKADRRYFAFSPRFASHPETGEESLQFWLNPMDQHAYNSRWCTVEELDMWIEGRGPIVKGWSPPPPKTTPAKKSRAKSKV